MGVLWSGRTSAENSMSQRMIRRAARRPLRGLAPLLALIVPLGAIASCSDSAAPPAAAPAKAPETATATPAAAPETTAAPPAAAPPPPVATLLAGTQTFVNSKDNLDGTLAEHYIDFSFSYPAGWTLDPESGKPGASNFAKVTNDLEGGFTVENFAVGYFFGTGSAVADAALFPTMAAQLSTQFEPGFPGYRKISEGKTRVGSYDGYELRFESTVPETGKGDMTIWGRAVMMPLEGSSRGVTIVMMATNLSPDVKGIDDVGVKGDLPFILDSLKLGK